MKRIYQIYEYKPDYVIVYEVGHENAKFKLPYHVADGLRLNGNFE